MLTIDLSFLISLLAAIGVHIYHLFFLMLAWNEVLAENIDGVRSIRVYEGLILWMGIKAVVFAFQVGALFGEIGS